MSQYNKTVLTRAGLELAKKANAGQAKFGITRAVSSAEDWSYKTTQDLEEVTAIPNVIQNGTIMDAEEVESNNAVIGVSLKFTNKDLTNGYQIRIIGLYVKEEGAKDEILYAITTAVSPEYMPSFADKVLYRFNMQMYLVIGKAQAVNVVIDEGTAVTHGQFDKYKDEVDKNIKAVADTHKEDMNHAVRSASINGGPEVLPDTNGKLNLDVPDPDLSKYVSLDQLKEFLKSKADVSVVPDKSDTEEGIRQAKAAAKNADDKAQDALNRKAEKTDVYTKSEVDTKTRGTIVTGYDVATKTATKETNAYNAHWLVDQGVLGQFADAINALKQSASVAILKDFPTSITNLDKLPEGRYNTRNLSEDAWNKIANKPNIDKFGTIICYREDNDGWQLAFSTNNPTTLFFRGAGGGVYSQWQELKNYDTDINDLRNSVNGKLPLTGGNMNLGSIIQWAGGGISDNTGNLGGLVWIGGTDNARIFGDQNGNDNLDLVFDLGDDASNHYSFRWNGSEKAAIVNDGKFTGRVDWDHVNGLTDPNITAGKIANHDTRLNTLEQNQFEVQTFTDANAAANWEAQRPGKRMAIVNR